MTEKPQRTYQEKLKYFEDLKQELGVTHLRVFGPGITPTPEKAKLRDEILDDIKDDAKDEELKFVSGLLSSATFDARNPEKPVIDEISNQNEGVIDDLISLLEDRKAGFPNSKLIYRIK